MTTNADSIDLMWRPMTASPFPPPAKPVRPGQVYLPGFQGGAADIERIPRTAAATPPPTPHNSRFLPSMSNTD